MPWFHVKVKLFWRILVFYFNMEPRVKWNKIIFRVLRCVLRCILQWYAVVCGFQTYHTQAVHKDEVAFSSRFFLWFVRHQDDLKCWQKISEMNGAPEHEIVKCILTTWIRVFGIFLNDVKNRQPVIHRIQSLKFSILPLLAARWRYVFRVSFSSPKVF